MRTIKFRSWDEEKHKMIQMLFMSFDENRKKHLKLMQYTGLRDKMGGEIYEGDIICYEQNETYGKGIVKYTNGCFCLDGDTLWPLHSLNEIRIVGNIYENTELLWGAEYMRYREIFRLKKMLEKENIKFEFYNKSIKDDELELTEMPFLSMYVNEFINNREAYQILIRKNNDIPRGLNFDEFVAFEKENRLVSVVQGDYTYGHKDDLLEIMGLTENGQEVEGWLTAEEVLKRIKNNI